MEVIFPAYNIKAEQATRYEAQIAAIMHRNRNAESNVKVDLPDDSPMRRQENSKRLKGLPPIQKEKPLTPTDEIIMRLLKGKKLTSREIMKATALQRDTLRAALLRLGGRGLLIKEARGNHITWHTAGGQTHAEG